MDLLSSYNVAAKVQEYVCEALNNSPYLSSLGISFYAENRQDIEYQIKNALTKQGIACIVTTPEMTYQGHDGADMAWDIKNLTLQIAEYVPVSRAKNKLSATTGLDIANFCQNYLGGPQCAEDFGKFCPVKIEQGEDSGLLVTKATFDTMVVGSVGVKWEWDGTHVVESPYLSRSELDSLSTEWTGVWQHWTEIWSDISVQVGRSEFNSALSALSTYVDENVQTLDMNKVDVNEYQNDIQEIQLNIQNIQSDLTGKADASDLTSYVQKFSQELSIPSNQIITNIQNQDGYLTVTTQSLPGQLSAYDDDLSVYRVVSKYASTSIQNQNNTVPTTKAVYDELQYYNTAEYVKNHYTKINAFNTLSETVDFINSHYINGAISAELQR